MQRKTAVLAGAFVLITIRAAFAREVKPSQADFSLELIQVRKLAENAYFGDIIEYRRALLVTFRSATGHGGPDGRITILRSNDDGKTWDKVALLEMTNYDLRDPHFCILPDGRLMLNAGVGADKGKGRWKGIRRGSCVAFSENGFGWTKPREILDGRDEWLWRMTLHNDGYCYGVVKETGQGRYGNQPDKQYSKLLRTKNGLNFQVVADLLKGKVPNEGTIRFGPDQTAYIVHRLSDPRHGLFGISRPPYKRWSWTKTDCPIAGPNLILLPNGKWLAGGRVYQPQEHLQLGRVDVSSGGYLPILDMPTSGDCSYPGFLLYKDKLWVTYYSSHDGPASFYLAQLKIKPIHNTVKISNPINYDGRIYSRATLWPDRTIYLHNNKKSIDGGKTIVDCQPDDPDLNNILNLHRSFLNTHSHPRNRNRFLALDYALEDFNPPQKKKFALTYWHSDNVNKTPVKKGTAIFHIPTSNVKFDPNPDPIHKGYGLFCNRGIFEDDKGDLWACCFGNFEIDTIAPPQGADIGIKSRCFLVKSTDGGKNWHYVSTVAAPTENMKDNQEGFNESALAFLDDGRMLIVMRTGHWTDMVHSYSSDGGLTWTAPASLPGLTNGVCPDLIKLKDGRLALACGRNTGNDLNIAARNNELAISRDGTGRHWERIIVAPARAASTYPTGGAYPTIFEVEPNVIFYQADAQCWTISLPPRKEQASEIRIFEKPKATFVQHIGEAQTYGSDGLAGTTDGGKTAAISANAPVQTIAKE